MAHKARTTAPPASLILDAGAIIDAATSRTRTLVALKAARDEGAEVIVPAVVVAETVRGAGPRDARGNLILRGVSEITPTTEDRARIAGALLAAAKSDDTIGALVVAEAVGRGGGVILTGDPDYLRLLASGHREVVISAL